MGRRPRTLALCAVLLGTLVAGCSDDSAGDDASTERDADTGGDAASGDAPAADAPEVGDCFEPMTAEMAHGTRLPALVACDEPHGGEVIATYELPDGPYPASAGAIEGADDAMARCEGDGDAPGDFATYIGDNRLEVPSEERSETGVTEAWVVSGLQRAMYVPGTAAWSDGDRWLVCAVVLNNSFSKPSTYAGSAKDALATPGEVDAAFAWCKSQPDPDNIRDFESVACTEPHNFEQLASFLAGGDSSSFPGEVALDELAGVLCNALSSAATGGRSDNWGDGFRLSWTYPQDGDWQQGDRFVRCYAATVQGSTTGSVANGTAAASD